MKHNSNIMNVFLSLKLDSIAWSLRRLYVPVDKNALVLEVGSGGNPYVRSNVLIDSYIEPRERDDVYTKLITDRPTVLGFAENLPFKDNSFDFVIASEVLEHSKNPEKFLTELQRVARAGYIETPDAFSERLSCYTFHLLEITDYNGLLMIRKKKNYIQDEEIFKLFCNKVSTFFGDIVSKYPFAFHVRYYWSKENGGINYKIVNPEYDFDWQTPMTEKNITEPNLIEKINFKRVALNFIRKYFSQNKRNKEINIFDLIQCPNCKNDKFDEKSNFIVCENCGNKYEIIQNKIIKFN